MVLRPRRSREANNASATSGVDTMAPAAILAKTLSLRR